MSALIRPMQAEDLAVVHRIENHNAAFPWTAGHFADSLAAGHDCWSLVLDDALIGYAIAMPVVEEVHLLNLGVDVMYQRQGWGRRLLGWVEEQARACAHDSVLLEVRRSNVGAIALYASAAYQAIGVRKAYYPALNGREDAWVMRKTLMPRSEDE